MVERRLQVLMTSERWRIVRRLRFLEEVAVDERTFPNRARHGSALLLGLVTRGHDEFRGGLVRPGLLALGRLAPRRDRMTAARSTAFAAAVRMVDRVHDDAAVMRTTPEPALTAGLADRRVHVVRVGHRADRAIALAMDEALLARIQANDHVTLVATDDLRVGAGGTGDRAALADLQLDVVHDRADRDRRQRHGVAGLHVDLRAGDHLVAGGEPLRRDDVGLLAVLIVDEGDERGAVGIVFDPLDLGGRLPCDA